MVDFPRRIEVSWLQFDGSLLGEVTVHKQNSFMKFMTRESLVGVLINFRELVFDDVYRHEVYYSFVKVFFGGY